MNIAASTPNVHQQLIERLSSHRNVLITTHVRPDGDALGTSAAMSLALAAKNIRAEILLLSHLPSKYAFIYKENGISYHDVEAGFPANYSLSAYDALLVVDTGTWSQLPGLQKQLESFRGEKLVMDHHLTQENWADFKLVDTVAAAAGEIAAELLEQWKIPFTPAIASALYLAIVCDTGWFQYSNTRPRTLRLAADLVEAGVDTDRIYQLLYQNERAQRFALQSRAQQSLELLCDQRLAVMRVTQADFRDTGASVTDTENLVNLPLQIRTVEVSIVMTEPTEPSQPVRVSLRSKGSVDVARFAEQFAGGGHARASGLKLNSSLTDAHDRVVSAMIKTLQAVPVS